MSILIKGMKMPKTCMNGGCPIDGNYCDLWWKAGGGSYGRHRDCPLIELPDHGELIDRDELMKHEGYVPLPLGNMPVIFMSYVKGAPVVIPAERRG